MLHIQVPTIIKVREGITVNLSMSVSHAVEHALPQSRLKKEYTGNPHEAKPSDYEVYDKCNTVSFWFVGGTSLAYREGHEITAEDFQRVKRQMEGLIFNDRKSGNNPASK